MNSDSGKEIDRNSKKSAGDSEKLGRGEKLKREFKSRYETSGTASVEDLVSRNPGAEEEVRRLIASLESEGIDIAELFSEDPAPAVKMEAGRILDDFRIIREIGAGGMGVVYEAEQISLNRPVALKILPPHLSFSDKAVLRFRLEAEAGGRQSHPGIVAIFAVGEHEGVHYLAQELVEGGKTLVDFVKDMKARSAPPKGYFRKIAGIAAEVADALQHAHDSGAIHRDVKPNNILLARDDRPKVTDFGLAKVENAQTFAATGSGMGTPCYMSPEQAGIRGQEIDSRTDIFSLGVTLYELLTLTRPFDGKTSQEILNKIVHEDPRDPSRLSPRVPRDLAVICLKALEKKPDMRYRSMSELSEDLRRYLDGEVILAKPAGVGTKVLKRIKRNPVFSAGLALAGVAVFTLVVAVPWIIAASESKKRKEIQAAWTKEEQARKEAERQTEIAEEARVSEMLQKLAAKEESARKLVVNKFFQRMLAAPSPYVDGRDVKLIDVLEKADKGIFAEFSEHPLVKCEIQQVIGISYTALGEYGSAKPHLLSALELSLEQKGEDHADTARIRNALGKTLWKTGKIDLAREQFEKAFPIAARELGEENELTLTIGSNIGLMFSEQGMYPEAIAILEDVLEKQTRTLGEGSSSTLGTKSNYALALAKSGHRAEARPLLEECLAGLQEFHGEDHPDTLTAMNNLSHFLDPTEAEPLQRRALEAMIVKLGRGHPGTLPTTNNLALSLLHQNKVSEAIDLLSEALPLFQDNLNQDHPHLLKLRYHYGKALLLKGRYSDAEPYLIEAHENLFKTAGEEDLSTLQALNDLATAYFNQKRFAEAEQLYRKVLTGLEKTMGTDHEFTLKVNDATVVVLTRQQKYSEAIPFLERGIRSAREGKPGLASSLTDRLNVLGGCLVRSNRLQEAEAALKEALESPSITELQRNRALNLMVELYEKREKPDEAAEYRKRISSQEDK